MDGRIIAVHTGSPGPAGDSAVYKRMYQSEKPSEFFSAGEYLLPDSAYKVSKPAFLPTSPQQRTCLRTQHLTIIWPALACDEHCIGVLKGRWQSQKELRHKLRNDNGMGHLCHWVVACCVLHNIMADIWDEWTEGLVDVDDGEPFDVEVLPTTTGAIFRDILKKQLSNK